MRQKVQTIIAHPLISGSSIVLAGSFTANIFNYIFNLLMGRMLSVEDYGLLISLTSFFILLTILNVALTTIFAKFAAKYTAGNNSSGMKQLFVSGTKFSLVFSTAITIILLLLSPVITLFLHVPSINLTILVILGIYFSLLYAMPIGLFQGRLQMGLVTCMNVMQPVTKIIVGVGLVYLGFQVFGAVTGVISAGFIALIVGAVVMYRQYKTMRLQNESKTEIHFMNDFYKYSFPVFLSSVGITLLSNTDVMLVRHFFSAETSGHYAALSLMGKAMLYLTLPINFVFFPLIAQKKERKERLFSTVMLTLGLVSLASLVMSFVYFLFPQLVLAVFFPSPEYRVLSGYLGIFSLYILLFSIVSIFNSFFMSIEKTDVYKLTLAAGVLQIVLLALFHSSLFQVIGVLFSVNALLLAGFLVYYLKHGKD